ncbi:hypothetical protein [Mycobacterium paragordonae]|uniref:Uncharacterized protein n=1 Tax=Mycobacterium paragordonae TaxID=1389713 RepID=A0AAJ1SFJ7_9MYCO|nr:hypothetical protein [Mycobacterium paragordonae]MDP7739362.1 hypothetical protein [Mycobacterium paragordonae]RUP03974.1 MAG: hypothetical protein EKK34_16410 [Mycobacterium sp.]
MPVIEQSPITSAPRTVPTFIQDADTRWWAARPGQPQVSYPTRSEVIVYAQSELAKLTRLPRGWDGARGRAVHTAVANLAVSLIKAIAQADGLATPQFSPLPDGGLNVVWLVDGDQLTIAFEDGELAFRGYWADGREAFDHELAVSKGPTDGQRLLGVALDDSRIFLEKISAGVQHQLIPR